MWYNNNVRGSESPSERTGRLGLTLQARQRNRQSSRTKKSFQNPLTLDHESDIMNTQKRKENLPKPERITTMKNTTYATVYNFLKANGFDNAEILAEFEKELNRDIEAKREKEALYAKAKTVVLAVMDAPATTAEIFDAVEAKLPEGFTKGMMRYAIAHLWKDEIVKTEGKVNTYQRKEG